MGKLGKETIMKKKRKVGKIIKEDFYNFNLPDCYAKNLKLHKKRIQKEEQKKLKDEQEFFEWYENELKKYGYK